MLSEKYHISKMYTDISSHGWLYWALSLPLYVLLWDLVFYVTHLVLHMPLVYRKSHFRHHACRPPVPWSGIAVDPIETILSGMMPYIIPLFITAVSYLHGLRAEHAADVLGDDCSFVAKLDGKSDFRDDARPTCTHTYGLKLQLCSGVYVLGSAVWNAQSTGFSRPGGVSTTGFPKRAPPNVLRRVGHGPTRLPRRMQ